jgi:signal transduction histidine kinase
MALRKRAAAASGSGSAAAFGSLLARFCLPPSGSAPRSRSRDREPKYRTRRERALLERISTSRSPASAARAQAIDVRRGGVSIAALMYVAVAGAAGWVAAFATLYAAVGGLLFRTLLSAPRLLTASSRLDADEPVLSREDRARLAALVRERTAELEAARTLAEDTNRATTLFLANMSHELRTPMHAVLSYAQLGRDAHNPGEQRDYFERIAERGHALLHLLSDLLDLSRLESGSMSMEYAPHDLEALVRDAFQQAEPAFRAKRVSSEFKRTPDFFDKFVESSKTRTNAGGTGLGLAICRQIVALHEGAVVASNNIGPGATMRVVLPLAVCVTTRRHVTVRGVA